MGPTGLEPAAYCLGGSRSIHLSYGPVRFRSEQYSAQLADISAPITLRAVIAARLHSNRSAASPATGTERPLMLGELISTEGL